MQDIFKKNGLIKKELMKTISEKEILFDRFNKGEMNKKELSWLIRRLLLDQELNEWFTIQMEFVTILHDPRLNN
jgi:hypothetical protein